MRKNVVRKVERKIKKKKCKPKRRKPKTAVIRKVHKKSSKKKDEQKSYNKSSEKSSKKTKMRKKGIKKFTKNLITLSGSNPRLDLTSHSTHFSSTTEMMETISSLFTVNSRSDLALNGKRTRNVVGLFSVPF